MASSSSWPDADAPWRALGFPTRETWVFPNIVNAEVIRGACPCRCGHCPVGLTPPADRETRFGRRSMNPCLFERIAREVGSHPWSTLRLHAVGDPILWSYLPEALDVCRQARARTWLFTSAVTADRLFLEAVGRQACIVEVSVNSRSAADYRRTKGVDAFGLVVENLHRLREVRPTGARLIVSRTQSDDEAEDAAFVGHWRQSGLVDDAFVRSYHSYNGILPSGSRDAPRVSGAKRRPCLVHWARFNVDVEGRAVVCFNELFRSNASPDVVYGSLQDNSIASIWHGANLAGRRRADLEGDMAGAAPPCRTCTACQPLDGHGVTSEHQVRRTDEGASCLP